VLTELFTTNDAAEIVWPIALTITDQATINHEPFVLAIMIAASASFVTPLG
jgi:di/tricarboxylate transporter